MFRFVFKFSVKCLFFLAVSSLLTLGAVPAQAALVSVDDTVFGVDSVTFDTDTNLEWLDVTFSTNRTIADIRTQFGAGDDFEGWRYANSLEVVELFDANGLRPLRQYGVDYNYQTISPLSAIQPIIDNLLALFGSTYASIPYASGPGTAAFYDNPATGFNGISEFGYSIGGTDAYSTIDLPGPYNDSYADPALGSWLVRDAFTPGGDPTNPLLPDDPLASTFVFDITAIQGGLGTTDPLFIDPEVAIGYDYTVENGGPNFASVLIPDLLADDEFLVSFLDGLGNEITQSLFAGMAFNFLNYGTGGVDAFSITDIDPSLMLDPEDSEAFVTGVTFVEAGTNITVTMTPRTSVPEALSLTMFSLSLGAIVGIGAIRRRKSA